MTAVKTILVIGASGLTGTAITKEAVRRGFGVTAYVRDKAKAAGLPSGVRVIEGDGRDAATLPSALSGIDAAVIPAGGRKDPVSAEIVKTIVPLLHKNGILRLIAISAYGAVDGRGFYGWLMQAAAKPVVADKTQMEQVLRASGLDWTAVRPGVLTDGAATGRVVAAENAQLKGMPRISRADVAVFVVDELEHPKFNRGAPVISV